MQHSEHDHRARLAAARTALAGLGWDGLVIPPSADLRYLIGYPAVALERLTCLVLPPDGEAVLVVPRLERPAAEASPAVEAGVRIVDYPDGTDPYPLAATALGGAAGTVGMGERAWAGHLLALQQALPTAGWRPAGSLLEP